MSWILNDEDGQPLRLGPLILDGNGVEDAAAELPQDGLGSWVVNVTFNGTGAPQWRTLVEPHVRTPLAGNGSRSCSTRM